jgi:microcystin-dependent protein
MADFKISEDYIVDKRGYAQSYPVGSVVIIMSSTIPDGWLLCDGSPINTFTYQELHKVVTNTYGGTAYSFGTTDQSGVSTTFNLPPLVVNATHNPSGRYSVSRVSSEPAYPSFEHNHYFYKDTATSYSVSTYSQTHNHSGMNINSNASNITHNHATMGGGSGLNNVTASAASSRQSSANNAVQYHNTPSHDHGGAFTTSLTMNTSASVLHSHSFQVHSADNISHTHTANQNTIVSMAGTNYQGVESGTTDQLPLSKEVYFIIKY